MFRFLFSIFAIVMLPFASPFLSARLRARVGTRKVVACLVVLLVVIPAVLAMIAPTLLKSPYLRFMEKDKRYYAELARACDLVLQQHPLGTNATIIPGSGTNASWAFIHISGTDPSLPRIIRKLNPSQITVSSNRVHIMVGVRDFGISWEPQDEDTNSWALQVYPGGPDNIVYVEKKR